MKKLLLTLTLSIILTAAYAQTRHVISNNSIVYTPDSLVVNVGDTVEFSVTASHPTLEVDQSTWQNNGVTSNNGFNFPSGEGDFVVQNSGTFYYVCQNHVSSGMKGRIFAMPLSNHEQELSQHEVYPNPVASQLFIEMDVNTTAEKAGIYGLNGNLIKAVELQSFNNLQQINVANLKAGVYILRFSNGNTAQQIRFVKK